MKNSIQTITALLCATTILYSCAVSENATVQKPSTAQDNNISKTCFVQLNDGSIKQYHSLKLVTGVLTTPHLLADNNIVINAKDIIAYQDGSRYAVSAKLLTSKKEGYVAAEALPGFAIKLLSGKLNLYSRKYYNGASTSEEYFLQDGNDAHIIAFSKEALKSMLREDTKALEYFNSRPKQAQQSKKIIATVDMHNNNQLVTKN